MTQPAAQRTDPGAQALKHLETCRVTADTFEERVLKADRPVMVFFWAGWCEPCRAMAPVVVSLARACEGRLAFASVDTDRDEELARQQSVAGLPTTILYSKGEALHRFVGAADEGVSEAIDSALGDA